MNLCVQAGLMVGAVFLITLTAVWAAGRWAFGRDSHWDALIGIPAALVLPTVIILATIFC